MVVFYRIYESIFVFSALYFLFWAIISEVKVKMSIVKRDGKKIVTNKLKPDICQKICTQSQPFYINENYGIICNFCCDGNCRIIKNIDEYKKDEYKKVILKQLK
jgi:hypothetical protein